MAKVRWDIKFDRELPASSNGLCSIAEHHLRRVGMIFPMFPMPFILLEHTEVWNVISSNFSPATSQWIKGQDVSSMSFASHV